MDIFIKSFLGVFIWSLLTLLSVGIISSEIETSKARDYFEEARCELSNYNLSDEVIDTVIDEAKAQGYKLECAKIHNENRTESVGMRLTYQCRIPILGVSNQYTIRGYAN